MCFNQRYQTNKHSWDNFYALETNNFKENAEDTGECWFNDNDAEMKMIDFLMENLGEHEISEESRILDVGTGNGHLLFELRNEGFKGELVGIDYSEKSVEFARLICKEKEFENVSFEQVDLFESDNQFNSNSKESFSIVMDKGTLDAIALGGDATLVEKYSSIISKYLVSNGVFLITSCNFTQDELTKIILENNKDNELEYWKNVPYPSFEFGGVKGSTICTLAFVKK